MKMNVLLLASIAVPLLISAGCASGPAAVADNDPARIVCRNEAPVGSRLPKRVCKTAFEWEVIAAKNLEERRKLRRSAIAPAEGGSLPGN